MEHPQVEKPAPDSNTHAKKQQPDDFQSVEISAVVKIYDPNSKQVIVEARG